MILNDILPAIQYINDHLAEVDLRGQAYLRTYQANLDVVAGIADANQALKIASCLAYGWMPRILRLDPVYWNAAVAAVEAIRNLAAENGQAANVNPLASCLHSLVGASKVAHFLKPQVFPIWDSVVEGFHAGNLEIDHQHMQDPDHYQAYIHEVRQIVHETGFDRFRKEMTEAMENRHEALNIPVYEVSDLRLIDLAIFELRAANGAEPDNAVGI